MTGAISYDLVMEDDMSFVEGCYRIEDGNWQVIIVSKRPVEKTEIAPSTWDSGVTGVVIHLPNTAKLNREVVKQLLRQWLGVDKWTEVRGPDSMQLR